MSSLAAALLNALDDDALDLLADALAPRLAARLAPDTQKQAVEYLNAHDAARYLACSRDRLYDLVQVGKLDPRRDGRRLLFRRDDLAAYLERSA